MQTQVDNLLSWVPPRPTLDIENIVEVERFLFGECYSSNKYSCAISKEIESLLLDEDCFESRHPTDDADMDSLAGDASGEEESINEKAETYAELKAFFKAAETSGPIEKDLTSLKEFENALNDSRLLEELYHDRSKEDRPESDFEYAPETESERSFADACTYHQVNKVRDLLSEGQNPNETTEGGESMLTYACALGYSELAEVLLSVPPYADEATYLTSKSSIHLRNKINSDFLSTVNHQLTKVLVSKYANFECGESKADVFPSLIEASRSGYHKIVKLLLEHGANVNAREKNTGETALTCACALNFQAIVRILLDNKADTEQANGKGYTPLMEACVVGDCSLIRLLLTAEAGVNHTIKGLSSLMLACRNNHIETVELLLTFGAEVNIYSDIYKSPLMIACVGGFKKIVELLILNGAALEEGGKAGFTPLMAASKYGHDDLVILLTDRGADINRTTTDNEGNSLSFACTTGRIRIVKLLMCRGADPSRKLNQSNILLKAICAGQTEVVKFLLDFTFNFTEIPPGDALVSIQSSQTPGDQMHLSQFIPHPNLKKASASASQALAVMMNYRFDVNGDTNSYCETPLTLACHIGHFKLVRILISKGAKVECRNKAGYTPLIVAVKQGYDEIVTNLIDVYQANVEAECEQEDNMTPLCYACLHNQPIVVKSLLVRGAKIEYRNSNKLPPMVSATRSGSTCSIKMLLECGADINVRFDEPLGFTPLLYSAAVGNEKLVELLLNKGADVYAQLKYDKSTVLHLACRGGYQKVVTLLLQRKVIIRNLLEKRTGKEHTSLMVAAGDGWTKTGRILLDKGADRNAATTTSRETALMIAAKRGHHTFCKLLLSRRAQIDKRNRQGETALWLACSNGYLDVVMMLVNAKADTGATNNQNVFPLTAAFKSGQTEVVSFLSEEVPVCQFPNHKERKNYIETASTKILSEQMKTCAECIDKSRANQLRNAENNALALIKSEEQKKQDEKNQEKIRKEKAVLKNEKRHLKKKKKQSMKDSIKEKNEIFDIGRRNLETSVLETLRTSSMKPTVSRIPIKDVVNEAMLDESRIVQKKNESKIQIPKRKSSLQSTQSIEAPITILKPSNFVGGQTRGAFQSVQNKTGAAVDNQEQRNDWGATKNPIRNNKSTGLTKLSIKEKQPSPVSAITKSPSKKEITKQPAAKTSISAAIAAPVPSKSAWNISQLLQPPLTLPSESVNSRTFSTALTTQKSSTFTRDELISQLEPVVSTAVVSTVTASQTYKDWNNIETSAKTPISKKDNLTSIGSCDTVHTIASAVNQTTSAQNLSIHSFVNNVRNPIYSDSFSTAQKDNFRTLESSASKEMVSKTSPLTNRISEHDFQICTTSSQLPISSQAITRSRHISVANDENSSPTLLGICDRVQALCYRGSNDVRSDGPSSLLGTARGEKNIDQEGWTPWKLYN